MKQVRCNTLSPGTNSNCDYNVFIGYQAGADSEGYGNIYIGKGSGKGLVQNQSVVINFSIDESDLNPVTSGNVGNLEGWQEVTTQNTIIGINAGENSTGSRNVFLGYSSGKNNNTSAYNIYRL